MNLSGPYIRVLNASDNEVSYTGQAPSHTWNYGTIDDHTDEVNVFYHTNFVHNHFQNSLGFYGLNHYQMQATVQIDWFSNPSGDPNNAWYSPINNWYVGDPSGDGNIYFGAGGGLGGFNNLARAADVIYHEYSHAVVDHIRPLLYQAQSGAMDEGFADYFSCSLLNDPIIGEWVVSDPQGLRNIDNNLRYPDDYIGQVHSDGRIYGGALWDLRELLSQDITDRLVLESLRRLPDAPAQIDFITGLNAVLEADNRLYSLPTTTRYCSPLQGMALEQRQSHQRQPSFQVLLE
jgi:hypothetical protein